jgi:hypothetical protein
MFFPHVTYGKSDFEIPVTAEECLEQVLLAPEKVHMFGPFFRIVMGKKDIMNMYPNA